MLTCSPLLSRTHFYKWGLSSLNTHLHLKSKWELSLLCTHTRAHIRTHSALIYAYTLNPGLTLSSTENVCRWSSWSQSSLTGPDLGRRWIRSVDVSANTWWHARGRQPQHKSLPQPFLTLSSSSTSSISSLSLRDRAILQSVLHPPVSTLGSSLQFISVWVITGP